MLTSSSESAVSIAADALQPISYLAMLNVTPALVDVIVQGEITIENPHEDTLLLNSITNQIASGQYARIDCETLDLEPESSVTCSYSANPTSIVNGTTSVTVAIPSGEITVGAAYEFEQLDERDRCIILTDSHFPDTPVARCADDDDLNYAYTLNFGAEGTEGADLEVVCGIQTHDSSILMQAMDSETEIFSEIAIEINQECIEAEETPES
jgi:hypothetical protein